MRYWTDDGKIDKAAAKKAVDFIECLKHHKGEWAGKQFKLYPWQKNEIINPLFGCLNEDGTRQYRTAYITLPRKNGKSTLCAAIGLFLLLADNEPGAEIYCAAGSKEQASLVFTEAKEMVKQSPVLLSQCGILESTQRIVYYKNASFLTAVSSKADLKLGYNAHGIIFDELHTQKNRALWDALTTSVGARRQPLVVAITTAGSDKNTICHHEYEYSWKILKKVVDDPTYFAYIREVPKEADWREKRNWKKANPALGTFRKRAEMNALFKKACEILSLQNTFRRLYLNQWTTQVTRWIDLAKWDASAGMVNIEALAGLPCYAGLDLASSIDIAAFVLVFPVTDDDGNIDFKILPTFWIPEDSIVERSKRDRVPYDVWAKMGIVRATPGNVIDYAFIEAEIKELQEKYNIKEIAYDRWGAIQLVQNLEAENFNMVPFGQGFKDMSPPTSELLTNVLCSKIHHGGNPVLRWMADNMVVRTDPAGNVKPDKAKSTERIDGMVALIMGLDRAIRHGHSEKLGKSVYEERGMVML